MKQVFFWSLDSFELLKRQSFQAFCEVQSSTCFAETVLSGCVREAPCWPLEVDTCMMVRSGLGDVCCQRSLEKVLGDMHRFYRYAQICTDPCRSDMHTQRGPPQDASSCNGVNPGDVCMVRCKALWCYDMFSPRTTFFWFWNQAPYTGTPAPARCPAQNTDPWAPVSRSQNQSPFCCGEHDVWNVLKSQKTKPRI